MYVYTYIYMYVHTHIYIYIYVWARLICAYICLAFALHIIDIGCYVCKYIHIYTYTCIYTYMYIYIRVCTFDINTYLSHVRPWRRPSHYCLNDTSPTPCLPPPLPGPHRICARTIVLHVQICFEFEFVIANVRICCRQHYLFFWPNKNRCTQSMHRYGVASVSWFD